MIEKLKGNKFFGLFVLMLVFAFMFGCTYNTMQNKNADTGKGNEGNNLSTNKVHIIEITSSGFKPNNITIKQNDTVVFINKDINEHWPASAVHPTHSVYPEKGGCIGSTFDACKGLKQNENFTFTFTHKGQWKYHDHLNPGLTGVINVE